MAFSFVTCASAAPVQKADTLTAASQLLSAGARCVIVPRAFGKARLLPPPDFELRDLRLPLDVELPLDPEVSRVLVELGQAYRDATGTDVARGRVTRVRGTPCPLAHVDRLRLRALVALRGPGVVLLERDDPDAVALRAGTGDAVFFAGFREGDPPDRPVWHRSPRRADWMGDRLLVQVDDW